MTIEELTKGEDSYIIVLQKKRFVPIAVSVCGLALFALMLYGTIHFTSDHEPQITVEQEISE